MTSGSTAATSVAAALIGVATLLVSGCSSSDAGGTPPSTVRRPVAITGPCVAAWSTMRIPHTPPSSTSGLAHLGIVSVPDGPIGAISAVSPNDVWSVGEYTRNPTSNSTQLTTLTEHWDGSSWTVVHAPDVAASVRPGESGDMLLGVAAISSHDVWAVGTASHTESSNGDTFDIDQTLAEHWDGSRWSVVRTPDDTPDDALTAVSARSSSDVWAVGVVNHGTDPLHSALTPLVEHWDGSHWSVVHVPMPRSESSFSAVHAIAADDVWAVGVITPNNDAGDVPTQTFTEHWDGTGWSVVNAPDVSIGQLGHGADDSLDAVSATGGDDVWAVGAASPKGTLTEHWDGTAWTIVPSAHSGFQGYLSDVAAVSRSDVWAAGSEIEHWDGHQWTQTATIGGRTFDPLSAIAAVSSRDVWMVGATEFLHYTCR